MPYLTPETVPDTRTCRALSIPDSPEWFAIFSGALTELTQRWNWEQQGISVSDAISVAIDVVNGYYDGCVSSGCEQPGGYSVLRVGPTGHVEQLINGEWVEPQGDNAFPPIPGRSEPTPYDRRCMAAANAALVLQELYEQVSEVAQYNLGVAELIIRLVDGLLVYFFWIAPILNGVLLIAIGILEVLLQGAKYITADVWDTTFDDAIRCLLFECATDDGEVVTFDYDCFLSKLAEPEVTPDWNEARARLAAQIALLLPVVGGVDALNQMGAVDAAETADCDGCDQVWCYFFDFTLSDQGWALYPAANGSYSAGVGWITGNVTRGVQRTLIDIQLTFPMTGRVTNFGMDYEYVAGNQQSGIQAVVVVDAVTPYTLIEDNMPFTPLPGPTDAQIYWEGDQDLAHLYVLLQTSINVHGGYGIIKGITLHGTGENPFGEDNC